MGERILMFLLLIFSSLLVVTARTANRDYQTLLALKNEWQNTPPDWERSNDPCGDGWIGIGCINGAVTSITLSSMHLTGQLSSEIGGLSELRILYVFYFSLVL
ncbi:leucine-rich repeat receptor protein kinase HPCA1-like [Arachis duranensis]|uniref:Leucine-rich repeat receptor protein kinase HPCA1-like n=1 Tax=Arachis duranensis TaxID=130453 RepID=A0A9C6WUZ1_ARADU|nr:leucine-rich repeat receptor protein kinase HPCA1-like [Arachis duranensis]